MQLILNGQYVQGAGGNLTVDLPATVLSRTVLTSPLFSITQGANLDGIVNLDFPGGSLVDYLGLTETILTATGGVTGQFAQVNSQFPVNLTYGATSVSFTVVPEPSSIALAGGALLLLTRRRTWARR